MADLLSQASTWLEGMRHTHASRPVVYQRGEVSLTLNATIGRTVFQVLSAEGAVEQVERRDYLVRAVDLVFGGVRTVPLAGDRIRESRDGKEYVYEAVATGQEKHFRPSDPGGVTLRVHTALVDTVEDVP